MNFGLKFFRKSTREGFKLSWPFSHLEEPIDRPQMKINQRAVKTELYWSVLGPVSIAKGPTSKEILVYQNWWFLEKKICLRKTKTEPWTWSTPVGPQ